VDGQPVQALAPQLTIPLPLTDLRDHAPDVRERLAQELLVAQSGHRFDLARGPLVCARLLRLADDEHILTVVMHHIVSDGWSLGVLIRELMALYVVQTTGRPAALAALPIQYADFAAWQRTRLQGAFLETQLGYWRAQLAGVPVLQLPTDYVRPVLQTYRSAHLPFAFAPTLTDGLKALSRRTGTTLFMTQFAVFVTLLGRLSGQPDFCVGSLVANRTQPELEELIGFFVNNLALRVDLRGRPSAQPADRAAARADRAAVRAAPAAGDAVPASDGCAAGAHAGAGRPAPLDAAGRAPAGWGEPALLLRASRRGQRAVL
jgi:hypothetical protein